VWHNTRSDRWEPADVQVEVLRQHERGCNGNKRLNLVCLESRRFTPLLVERVDSREHKGALP
jgi:hypothetical protein